MIERVEKIRKNIGNDYFIMLKIKCRESFDDSFTEEEFISYCKLTEKAGIDMLEFSSGDYIKLNAKEYKCKLFYFEETIKATENVKFGLC